MFAVSLALSVSYTHIRAVYLCSYVQRGIFSHSFFIHYALRALFSCKHTRIDTAHKKCLVCYCFRFESIGFLVVVFFFPNIFFFLDLFSVRPTPAFFVDVFPWMYSRFRSIYQLACFYGLAVARQTRFLIPHRRHQKRRENTESPAVREWVNESIWWYEHIRIYYIYISNIVAVCCNGKNVCEYKRANCFRRAECDQQWLRPRYCSFSHITMT